MLEVIYFAKSNVFFFGKVDIEAICRPGTDIVRQHDGASCSGCEDSATKYSGKYTFKEAQKMSDMRRHNVKAAYDEKRRRLKYELLMRRPEKVRTPEKKSARPEQVKRPMPMRW